MNSRYMRPPPFLYFELEHPSHWPCRIPPNVAVPVRALVVVVAYVCVCAGVVYPVRAFTVSIVPLSKSRLFTGIGEEQQPKGWIHTRFSFSFFPFFEIFSSSTGLMMTDGFSFKILLLVVKLGSKCSERRTVSTIKTHRRSDFITRGTWDEVEKRPSILLGVLEACSQLF